MSSSDSSGSSTPTLESRETAAQQIPDSPPVTVRKYGASGIQLPQRTSSSRRTPQNKPNASAPRSGGQTFSEFLRDNSMHQSTSEMSAEARRQSIIAMDRKRRLTGSTPDGMRHGTTPSSYGSGLQIQKLSGVDGPPSQPRRYSRGFDTDPNNQREVIDLTGSSPPQPQPQPIIQYQSSRTSSSSSRRYVVPPWQPDSEVGECPICERPFTWLFRRHHCRKCGRVVCNECSPHRITIPRQFIVNPPRLETPTSPSAQTISRSTETIDLTGDDEDENRPKRPQYSRHASNSFLDGGEKVRLCNPCVPDPQPEPLPNFPPVPDDHVSEPPYSQRSNMPPFIASRPEHNDNTARTVPGGISDLRWPGPHTYADFHVSRPRPPPSIDPYSMRPASLSQRAGMPDPMEARSYTRPRRFENDLPPLPINSSTINPIYGHGRFQSLDSHHRNQSDIANRPRVRTMIDAEPRSSGYVPTGSQFRTHGFDPHRPRLTENDICPICRRALPVRGPNGDESAREAHIMECIGTRDLTSRSGLSSSSTGVLHMVSFIATEKDCLGEEGNGQECSICMVEYNVGDQLSRLECFCKFHKECIVSWLNRKPECPVHKAGEMRMLET